MTLLDPDRLGLELHELLDRYEPLPVDAGSVLRQGRRRRRNRLGAMAATVTLVAGAAAAAGLLSTAGARSSVAAGNGPTVAYSGTYLAPALAPLRHGHSAPLAQYSAHTGAELTVLAGTDGDVPVGESPSGELAYVMRGNRLLAVTVATGASRVFAILPGWQRSDPPPVVSADGRAYAWVNGTELTAVDPTGTQRADLDTAVAAAGPAVTSGGWLPTGFLPGDRSLVVTWVGPREVAQTQGTLSRTAVSFSLSVGVGVFPRRGCRDSSAASAMGATGTSVDLGGYTCATGAPPGLLLYSNVWGRRNHFGDDDIVRTRTRLTPTAVSWTGPRQVVVQTSQAGCELGPVLALDRLATLPREETRGRPVYHLRVLHPAVCNFALAAG